MKKWLTILFFIVFISVGTEFNQILRLPLLVNHFIQHKNSNHYLHFLTFLQEHYLINHGDDADKKQDDALPFKTITSNNFTIDFFFTNQLYSEVIPSTEFTSTNIPNNDKIPISLIINMIWAPPRFS